MKNGTRRRIAVMVGSDSDLPQCLAGLKHLSQAEDKGQIEVVEVNTMSIHRNLVPAIEYLEKRDGLRDIDVIIAGAGWAAHLPGMLDAYLGYGLNNTHTSIIGVAFEDPADERHTLAAELSISEVPGTRVIHHDAIGGPFVGADGFLRACSYAVSGQLPVLKEMKSRPTQCRTLKDAIAVASST